MHTIQLRIERYGQSYRDIFTSRGLYSFGVIDDVPYIIDYRVVTFWNQYDKLHEFYFG